MYNKLRSLIFKLDPEIAHNLAIKSFKNNYFPQKKISKLTIAFQQKYVEKNTKSYWYGSWI